MTYYHILMTYNAFILLSLEVYYAYDNISFNIYCYL